MPGRKYQAGSTSYRYSINGQEKDKELNENITTALYWQYDSRIVRRWNIDPRPNTSISPYSCFANNPIWNSDPQGDTISPKRTKGMNFFIIAKADLRQKDIEAHGNKKTNSPYWADYKKAKRMEKKGNGQMIIIEANDPGEALQLMKTKLGEDGYVQNIVIDYHRSSGSFGNVSIEGTEAQVMFNELKQGFAGVGTSVYLGQCWSGGNSRMPNLTEDVSKQLDGATVYGHKSQASSWTFFFSSHFSGYVGETYEGYQESEEYTNVGKHVVSFYNAKLNKVSSVEIYEKIRIGNNGQIHSKFTINQLQNLPEVTPNKVEKPIIQTPFRIEIIPPPIEGN